MKTLKAIAKKTTKNERERKVLLGLVEHFLKTGKAVGSNTLKEMGFADLSSATIRNYFSNLEEEGYLQQHHSSGGRLPTAKAFRLYANECYEALDKGIVSISPLFDHLRLEESREINAFLQKSAEELAVHAQAAVFLSAPRFEQDFLVGIKMMPIDASRCVCILLTDFGEVLTEVLHLPQKMGALSSKRIESYFNWRLHTQEKPNLSKEEEELAQHLYNELLLRYIVNYSRFDNEELYRTGFSKLLVYPEFRNGDLLANTLSLFENTHGMHLLLKESQKFNSLKFWIGEDLATYSPKIQSDCAVIAIPYCVNQLPVGAVGLLGPLRIPYRSLFNMLHQFADHINENLSRTLYKFKITVRQPHQPTIGFKRKELLQIDQIKPLLLEDQRSKPSSRRKHS